MPKFSFTDVLAIGVAAVSMLVLVSAPAAILPRFAPLYAELGSPSAVPAFAAWLAPLMAAPILVLVALALRNDDLVRRRTMLASAAALGVLTVGALLGALYYPLYELSGNIAA